jgi:hypothetical protein
MGCIGGCTGGGIGMGCIGGSASGGGGCDRSERVFCGGADYGAHGCGGCDHSGHINVVSGGDYGIHARCERYCGGCHTGRVDHTNR